MDGEALVKEAAEIVMEWSIHPRNTAYYVTKENLGIMNSVECLVTDWKPLTNANQTKMLRDKALELGLDFEIEISKRYFGIKIYTKNLLFIKKEGKLELPITTSAIVEAVKRIRDLDG